MSAREFNSWREFFLAHPFDDEARFFRPIARLIHSNTGEDFRELLHWMRRKTVQDQETPPAPPGGWSEADMNTFKALGGRAPGR